MSFKTLVRDLLTSKYTTVEVETDFKYNAPHRYVVKKSNASATCGNNACPFNYCPYPKETRNKTCMEHIPLDPGSDILCEIHFQEGPIKECGVNGVCNEDLINMVIDRLEHFQNSDFRCRENALAITALEEALLWLRKRTMGREQRGVEGTHTV